VGRGDGGAARGALEWGEVFGARFMQQIDIYYIYYIYYIITGMSTCP